MKNGLDCNKVGGSCRYLGKIDYITLKKKTVKNYSRILTLNKKVLSK